MPARRFWMMERQISRIQAENDIRTMTLHSTVTPPQSRESGQRVEEFIGRLTLEIGETAKLRREIFVAPEPSARQKFLKIIGNG